MPGVNCSQCNERFYWTEHYGEKVCPRCRLAQFYAEREIDQSAPAQYTAPECNLDLPAAFRDQILMEVRLNGHAERCSLEMSNAFLGWKHEQIEQWCDEHNLAIIARHDGRIVICFATAASLRSHGITAKFIEEHEVPSVQK
jgi:hypothetical protein